MPLIILGMCIINSKISYGIVDGQISIIIYRARVSVNVENVNATI